MHEGGPTSEAQGALRTVLEQVGASSLAELAGKPTRQVIADLDRLTIPPSEALLGALVLNAVRELHDATERLDAGTRRMLRLTRALTFLAVATLTVAVVALFAS